MLLLASFKLAPALLLLVIATAPTWTLSLEAPWPYNLPPNAKYFPEDKLLVQRKAEIQKRLVDQRPIGVHKMGGDEGEMFFMEYWQFDTRESQPFAWATETRTLDTGTPSLRLRKLEEDSFTQPESTNVSTSHFQAPLSLHANQQAGPYHPHLSPRSVLWFLNQRSFQCPNDTTSCTSISRPNSCCPSGQHCQIITDVGNGDVGCCAQGQACIGGVRTCQQGYASCPGSSGGGCCIPGYVCIGVGCKVPLRQIRFSTNTDASNL